MIPACFSSPRSVSRNSLQSPQSLITCIYQTHLCNSPTYLTLTWTKTLFSTTLTIYSPDSFTITISLYPTTFSFFRARPGSKSLYLTHHHCNHKTKLYWDFTRAKFSQSGSAEPEGRFYVGIICNGKLDFFIGDTLHELTRRAGLSLTSEFVESVLLSRREHVFGRKGCTAKISGSVTHYNTTTILMGSRHEIGIEYSGGMLQVKVDGEIKLTIKRFAWKFRGNKKILVGGIEVEFYWDVFNWISNNNNNKYGNSHGSHHGVFMFQVGGDGGGVWPEMVGAEKKLMRKSLTSVAGPAALTSSTSLSPSDSCSSSVLQWAEESSDCGRSSCSSNRSYGSHGGFSLLLYAWKKE